MVYNAIPMAGLDQGLDHAHPTSSESMIKPSCSTVAKHLLGSELPGGKRHQGGPKTAVQ